MSELPLHGVPETKLDPPPRGAVEALARAVKAPDPAGAVRRVAARHPTFLEAWAALAELHLTTDPVGAYAFARTGYHRGLDAIRAAGWRGQGKVPYGHIPNRGFLDSLFMLMKAADIIGEDEEALRCREFLLQLDPDDILEVR